MNRRMTAEPAADAAADLTPGSSPPWRTVPKCVIRLQERGHRHPDDTWFVGGYHDTCSDDVELFDLDVVPATSRPICSAFVSRLDGARMRNAQERARTFESCPPDFLRLPRCATWKNAANTSREPRPEYGHCTNAVCVVGRRSLTRGLFLDRRAFLVSYDANQDPEDRSLAALMAAVVPVCAGHQPRILLFVCR